MRHQVRGTIKRDSRTAGCIAPGDARDSPLNSAGQCHVAAGVRSYANIVTVDFRFNVQLRCISADTAGSHNRVNHACDLLRKSELAEIESGKRDFAVERWPRACQVRID